MRKRYINQDPREITARFNSKCAETHKPIRKGEPCIYYPIGKKVFSMDSKQAYEFRNWKADVAMDYNY